MNSNTDRRSVLRLLAAAGCAAVTGLPQLTGCTAGAEDSAVSVDRREVEQAGRVVVHWQEQPVEIRSTADGFEARSLVCTHIGCTVRWDAATERYVCPCHEGLFDSEGRPVSGPPTEPLRTVPVRATENLVTVGA